MGAWARIAFALVATAALVLPGTAGAAGLNAAQRAAVTPKTVKASASPAGMIVTARFRGNLGRELGRRALRNAGAAVILYPTGAAGKPDTPKPDLTGYVVAATVGQTGAERLLDRGVPGPLAIIRAKNTVTFFLGGVDPAKIGEVVVDTFTSSKRLGARAGFPDINQPHIVIEEAFVPGHSILEAVAFGSFLAAPTPQYLAAQKIGNCLGLKSEIHRAESALSDVLQARAQSRRDHQPGEHTAYPNNLRKWIAEARKILASACSDTGSTTGGGDPTGGNPTGDGTTPDDQPPTASFTFSPSDPPTTPKAHVTRVTFTGTASDPDGTVASASYNVDGAQVPTDGGSSPGAPSMSMIFPSPGIFPVTLTVTDNAGKTFTTAQQLVYVSAAGHKDANLDDVPCPYTNTAPSPVHYDTTVIVDINIPSYAQNPMNVTIPVPPNCPNATISSPQFTFVAGAVTPESGGSTIDEWNRQKNHLHITFTLTGGPVNTPDPGPTSFADVQAAWS